MRLTIITQTAHERQEFAMHVPHLELASLNMIILTMHVVWLIAWVLLNWPLLMYVRLYMCLHCQLTKMCCCAGVAVQNSARSSSPTASRPMSHSPQPLSLPQSSANDHTAPFSPLAHAESADVPSECAHGAHVDMLADVPPGGGPKGVAESPSIFYDEQSEAGWGPVAARAGRRAARRRDQTCWHACGTV